MNKIVKTILNGMEFSVKEIEANKVYALETEHYLRPDEVEAILKAWQESTLSKAVLLDRIQVSQAIQRVRELHKPGSAYLDDQPMCIHCRTVEFPCPTIKALDGEQDG